MKSKAPLALMEQAIMLCVFALAAVLCLQAFLWADRQSDFCADRDRATVQAQNTAEVVKHTRGDLSDAARLYGGQADDTGWTVFYDENWQQTDAESGHRLHVTPEHTAIPLLGRAVVEVTRADGSPLALLNVQWQEVSRDG